MTFVKIILLAFLFIFSTFVEGKIFKCTDDEGKIRFQEKPCVGGGKEKLLSEPAENEFGIHPSWFDQPSALPEAAQCTETGCICADETLRYRQNVNRRIISSLKKLSSSWKRHQSALESQKRSRSMRSISNYRDSVKKAACQVSIHQKTISLYYKKTSKEIRSKYNIDIPTKEEAQKQCEYNIDPSNRRNCLNRTERERRSTLNQQRKYSDYYFSLMQEMKRLRKPRAQHY